MKTKVRAILCILLAVLTLISMSACSQKQGNQSMDYTIVSKDGKHNIVFDDIEKYEDSERFKVPLATVDFPSIKAFKDAVTKGTLTDLQKATIAQVFKRDEKGDVLTCDFNNLYEPVLPAEGAVGMVCWKGEEYGFLFGFSSKMHGVFLYEQQGLYNEIYAKEYENSFNNDNVAVTKIENLPDNKQAIYSTTRTADLKNIRFTLSDQGKTFAVDKMFCLRLEPELSALGSVSDTVPVSVTLYCMEGNQYYIINLYDLEEDPTDEWLLSFGITKYVENDHVAA